MSIEDFTHLAAVGAVLDRARRCLSREDLPGLVMSDPGSGEYVAAYARVLAGGVPALFEIDDGRRLLEGFAITENLLLSHTDASRSLYHRWFSVLTACIELLAWDGVGLRDTPLSNTLCNLLTDSFALQAAQDPRAPLDLLPRVCRELQQTSDRHLYVLALLCELLVSRLDVADVEAKCRELNQCHEQFQPWCDEDGAPNVWFVEQPVFIWGAALKGFGSRRPKDLPRWLELVKSHFPSSPELAQETAERLVREGKAWPRRGL